MSLSRWMMQRVPKSLWLQSLVLLVLAVVGTFALVGPWARNQALSQLESELDKRGHAMGHMLEKHADLRLAISLSDAALALPTLLQLLTQDDDVAYIAIIGPDKKPIAQAPDDMRGDKLQATIAAHFADDHDAAIRRFTQPVERIKDTGGGDPLAMEEASNTGSPQVLGYVLLGFTTDVLRRHVRDQTLATVGTTALLVFTALILVYLRWVARRLARMRDFAQTLSAGSLNHPLEDALEDDLGQLVNALRAIMERTRDVVARLVEASGSLSVASADLLLAASRQTSGSNTQAGTVSEMSAAVSELRAIFKEATERTDVVISMAQRSEDSSSGGTQAVQESIASMQHIRDQVEAITRTIRGLVQHTQQIGAIMDVVSDLAEQSNVLAINAGIEAARAGEAGRGFAVVAREVRSLSERSKESTLQVRSIIQDIHTAGTEAIQVIGEGSRRADGGVAVVQAAGEAIQRLGEAIAESSSVAMQIAAGTKQQSEGIEQIWQATRAIDQMSAETVQGIAELESAASNMKTLSAGLATLVENYRL